jgi:hypothetical protein
MTPKLPLAATATAGPGSAAAPESDLMGVRLPDLGEYHPAMPFEMARVVNPWFDATDEISRDGLGAETHQLPAASTVTAAPARDRLTASTVAVTTRKTTLTSYWP